MLPSEVASDTVPLRFSIVPVTRMSPEMPPETLAQRFSTWTVGSTVSLSKAWMVRCGSVWSSRA